MQGPRNRNIQLFSTLALLAVSSQQQHGGCVAAFQTPLPSSAAVKQQQQQKKKTPTTGKSKPLESSTSIENVLELPTSSLYDPLESVVASVAVTAQPGEGATLAPPPLTKTPPQQQLVTVPASVAPAAVTITAAGGNLYSPAEAFELLVQKGEHNAEASVEKTLFSAALGGAYVGMGAMMSLAVAGNAPNLDYGLQKLLFGALFPFNLLLALQCGGQLYTGNTAAMMAAVCEGRATYEDLGRSWGLSWVGNAIGCGLFAVACKYAGVLEGGAGHLAALTLATKTSSELGPILVKAMFCNWLVCIAVFLSTQAKDMTGKYLSIWLPVSAFVSIGFEHSVANLFLLPAGLMSTDEITFGTAMIRNLLPVTIGNAISGSLFVGAAMSYMYGSLGKATSSVEQVDEQH